MSIKKDDIAPSGSSNIYPKFLKLISAISEITGKIKLNINEFIKAGSTFDYAGVFVF